MSTPASPKTSTKIWKEMRPDEKRAACVAGRLRGQSAAEIAREYGTSRSAILGTFHRSAELARLNGEEPPAGPVPNGRPRHIAIKPRANPFLDDGRDPRRERAPTARILIPVSKIAEAAEANLPDPLEKNDPANRADGREAMARTEAAAATAGETAPFPPVTLLERERGQCAWPVDSLPDAQTTHHFFCGRATGGPVYCPEHRARARGREPVPRQAARRAP